MFIVDTGEKDLAQGLHCALVDGNFAIYLDVPRTVIVKEIVENKVDLRDVSLLDDVLLIYLNPLVFLLLLLIVLLLEVAYQELEHLRLHLTVKTREVLDRVQVKEYEHIGKDRLSVP